MEEFKEFVIKTKADHPKLYAVAVNKPLVNIKIIKNRNNFFTKNKVFIALEEFESCGRTIKVGGIQYLSDNTIFKDEEKGFYEYENIIFLNDRSRTEEEILEGFKETIVKNVKTVLPNMRAEEMQKEPKNEKYIVWNKKGNNPKVIHENFINAEREAFRLAKENPNQEFYVLKVVGKAKGSVKVEWSE